MCDCPCIADDSLGCLSGVTSLEDLKLDMCDKITDKGKLLPDLRPVDVRPSCT